MPMINRIFERKVRSLLLNNPAVVLMGPRQVGKTTLAKQILNDYKKSCIYLDMENRRDKLKLSDPVSYFERYPDHLIIIDEVQTEPSLFTDMRPAIDMKRKNGRFLLLGSASPGLISGASESLGGRIDYLEIPPFIYPELKGASNTDKHWIRGGFPLSFTAKNNALSMQWRNAFITGYIRMDFSLLFNREINSTIISNFWTMLAHVSGGLWNAHTFSKSLGVSVPTVKKYLDYLEYAFLTRRLQPWHVNTAKRLVKSPKIYIRDSGLLHTLLNLQDLDDVLSHPIAGNSWEGYVIEQISNLLPNTIKPYFFRSHQGAEADLVLVKGITPIAAIDIKLSNAPAISKGFYESIKDLKTKSNFVITPAGDDYIGKENIQYCSLPVFFDKYFHSLKT